MKCRSLSTTAAEQLICTRNPTLHFLLTTDELKDCLCSKEKISMHFALVDLFSIVTLVVVFLPESKQYAVVVLTLTGQSCSLE